MLSPMLNASAKEFTGTPRQYESRVSQHPSAIDVAATLKIPLDFIQYSPFSVTSRIVTHKKRQKGVLSAQKQKERHSTRGPISSQTLILVCVCVCTSWIFISNTGSFMSCGFPLEQIKIYINHDDTNVKKQKDRSKVSLYLSGTAEFMRSGETAGEHASRRGIILPHS